MQVRFCLLAVGVLLSLAECPLQAATNETNQTVAEAERVKAEAEADRQALQEVRLLVSISAY